MSSTLGSENIQFSGNLEKSGAVTKGSILSNDGTGVFELVAPGSDGLVLTSNSAVPSGSEWSAPSTTTLSSAGGTVSLVNDGTGPTLATKGITEGTGISFVDSGTAVTVNSVWNQIGDLMFPVTSSTRGLLCGITSGVGANVIAGGVADSCIVGGRSGQITGGNGTHSMFVGGGTGNWCRGNNFRGPGSAIMGGENNFVNESPNATISGGLDNDIIQDSKECFIGGGELNSLASMLESCILGGSSNSMTGGNGANSMFIAGGISNTISSNGGATCSIIGGSNNLITNGTRNTILGSENVTTTSLSNTWTFSHGTAFSPVGGNTFNVKNTGGTYIYSNDAATTGVQLAAGASAWAAVSDRNKKENLVEVDCSEILNRVMKLPLYEYNFIGNPKEQKCIGPMAQDWHLMVTPLENVIVEEEDNEGNVQIVEKEAKDKLSIETMDAIGVCLSAIKGLKIENEKLEAENTVLKSKISILGERLSKIEQYLKL